MAIKGWKNAGRDLTKWRQEAKNEGRVKLVSLKKDGNESKLHDATTYHDSIEAAVDYHKKIHRLNPGKTYSHHIYDHQNKHVGKVHGPEGDLHHPDTQHSEEDTEWELEEALPSQFAEGQKGAVGTFTGDSAQFKKGQKVYLHHTSGRGQQWISHDRQGNQGSYAHPKDFRVGKWRQKGKASQHSEQPQRHPELVKVLEKHGFGDHEGVKTKTDSTHSKHSSHIVQHGADGSWEHHNVLKPQSSQGRGKGAKSLTEHLAKHGPGSSQHSETLATPVSFVPTSFGSVTPAIQFREVEAEQFGEQFAESDHSKTAHKLATEVMSNYHKNGYTHDHVDFRAHYGELDDAGKKSVTKHLHSRGLLHPLDAKKKKPLSGSELMNSVRGQAKSHHEAHHSNALNRHVPFSDSEAYKKATKE